MAALTATLPAQEQHGASEALTFPAPQECTRSGGTAPGATPVTLANPGIADVLGAALATPLQPSPWPSRSDCRYTACYCEENVFWLAQQLAALQLDLPARCAVVFISNPSKMVPIWRQRAGFAGDLVCWDYHVLMVVQQATEPPLVFDLDTMLPFPCSLADYWRSALLGGPDLPPQYHRFYRVVPALLFLRHFASDRSHMRDKQGTWLQPPPPYPCITAAAEGAPNTLPAYVDFSEQQQHLLQTTVGRGAVTSWQELEEAAQQRPFGIVLDETAFLDLFGLR